MDLIKTPKVDNVKLLERYKVRQSSVGTLYLTTTHLIFVDAAGKREVWILHMHMAAIDRLPLTTGGSPLQLRCKDFRCVTFVIPKDRECQDIYESLMDLSRPASIDALYAFHFTLPAGQKSYGWDMYDTQTEYLRMGIPNELWVLTSMNRDYELCDTYPRDLYVPATATTPILVGSSKFRSRGRLPALSYLHRDNQAAICRCSQPLAGFSARCVEDEQMLHAILRANPSSKFLYVVDTRPKINAMANKAAGKGYENENFYSDIKFQFLGIENIHVMRNGLQKLIDVCELKNPSMNSFLSSIEASGWLKHIKSVIDTSVFIVNAVRNGISVLVHCSDGWDRTAQTCSLASLMLDPYYRTIQGFQALIEKEWLSFGHKFTDRCGFLGSGDAKEVSPVFTQFVECVWQIMQQFPCAFQFNERFLITIHDHSFSCQFGTFIGNCEKDRVDLRLSERTYSLWGYISRHMNEFLNPLYKKEYEVQHPVVVPDTSPQCVRFWKGMYNRYETGIHSREHITDILGAAKDHSDSLEDHIRLLEKRITQICKVLGKSEETIQKKLDGFLSMESLDGYLAGHIEEPLPEKVAKDVAVNGSLETSPDDSPQRSDDSTQHSDDSSQRDKDHKDKINHIKSDRESGFDEASSTMSRSGVDEVASQMSKSGIEEGVGTMESSMLSGGMETLTLDQLLLELQSVAVDWRSFRQVHTCTCATPFDCFTKKFHCWKCGDVFCMRCIAKSIPLPGHYSRRPVPVCRPCYKEIRHSPSMEFPPGYTPPTNSS
ncbi:myotubularin-related protein 8-like isoform X2 [Mizuhopecten yessoensis]|uniref:phosphatidylinositol-3,5-bisphosphate 3-phosphatase n=1 Tax=Mizuhopecten yessoensis TaxID=6573 RepID=A0A210QVT4_MIZYE|nr:myotubularin-related protein 8-like isoform X2 [Mizuhopecten yessoensis]OWF52869.1 Myotubularin-related protein 8 [Mizuhopecten yessoensis]